MEKQALDLILKVIDLATVAIPAGSEALQELKKLRSKVNTFVAEGRDPTPEEFRELQNETDALSVRLDAADKRLNPR